MNSLLAFLVLATIYYIGEFIGTKTKAWIPSVFVIACLFLLGFWTFFPKDIVALAGMGTASWWFACHHAVHYPHGYHYQHQAIA